MTSDYIWDDTDGSHLGTIKDGKVFRPSDNRQIGTIRDGNIYSMDGDLLGHLSLPGQEKGTLPEAFLKLAKATDG